MKRGFLAIAALAAVVACTPQPTSSEKSARRADAIQGGNLDSTSNFAVGVVDSSGATCSGTLIAPNLVLTARHCIADDSGGATVNCKADRFSAPHAANGYRIDPRAKADFTTAAYGVSKIVVPPGDLFCGNDVALLVLDALVPAAVATPASPAVDPITDGTYGTTLTAIGYGTSKPGAADDGVRRKRDGVKIDCIPGDASGCTPSTYDMTPTELAAGNGLCEGDSGSGAYVTKSLAAGPPVVMGVLSRAADDGVTCSDAIYERTDSFAELLVKTANEAASAGGYAPPAWTKPKGSIDPDAGTSGGSTSGDPDAGDAGEGPSVAPTVTTSSSGGCAIGAAGMGRASGVGGSWIVAAVVTILLVSERRRSRGPQRKR